MPAELNVQITINDEVAPAVSFLITRRLSLAQST